MPAAHESKYSYYEDRVVKVSPDTLSIPYHVDKVWDDVVDKIWPTSANVVWLGRLDRWDGIALLLDFDYDLLFIALESTFNAFDIAQISMTIYTYEFVEGVFSHVI